MPDIETDVAESACIPNPLSFLLSQSFNKKTYLSIMELFIFFTFFFFVPWLVKPLSSNYTLINLKDKRTIVLT